MYRRNILGLKWLLSNNAKMTMQWQLPNNNEHLKFISEFQSLIFFFFFFLNYKYDRKTDGLCRDLNAYNLPVPSLFICYLLSCYLLSFFVLSNELQFYLAFHLLSNNCYAGLPTCPRVKPQFVICSWRVVSRISSLSVTT